MQKVVSLSGLCLYNNWDEGQSRVDAFVVKQRYILSGPSSIRNSSPPPRYVPSDPLSNIVWIYANGNFIFCKANLVVRGNFSNGWFGVGGLGGGFYLWRATLAPPGGGDRLRRGEGCTGAENNCKSNKLHRCQVKRRKVCSISRGKGVNLDALWIGVWSKRWGLRGDFSVRTYAFLLHV